MVTCSPCYMPKKKSGLVGLGTFLDQGTFMCEKFVKKIAPKNRKKCPKKLKKKSLGSDDNPNQTTFFSKPMEVEVISNN